MTAKDKASQLLNRFYILPVSVHAINMELYAKKAAIVSVNEIIEALNVTIGHCTLSSPDLHECMSDIKYWKEVKQEIDKL